MSRHKHKCGARCHLLHRSEVGRRASHHKSKQACFALTETTRDQQLWCSCHPSPSRAVSTQIDTAAQHNATTAVRVVPRLFDHCCFQRQTHAHVYMVLADGASYLYVRAGASATTTAIITHALNRPSSSWYRLICPKNACLKNWTPIHTFNAWRILYYNATPHTHTHMLQHMHTF